MYPVKANIWNEVLSYIRWRMERLMNLGKQKDRKDKDKIFVSRSDCMTIETP